MGQVRFGALGLLLLLFSIVRQRREWETISSYFHDIQRNHNDEPDSGGGGAIVGLPEALDPPDHQKCCLPPGKSSKEAKNKWKATCFTAKACNVSSTYPFTNVQQKEQFAKYDFGPKSLKSEHRQHCWQVAVERKVEEAHWCRIVPYNNNSHDDGNAAIPEAAYPMGCSRAVGMGGGSGPFDRLVVFADAKLAFCGVPKSGITRWIQFLRFTLGAKDYQDAPYYKLDYKPFHFDVLRPAVQCEIWNDPSWTRAILIREPTERLLSAFLDKIARRQEGKNVTLEEFVTYLERDGDPVVRHPSRLFSTGLSWHTDPHWRPQAYSCGLALGLLPYFHHVGGLDRVAQHTREILESVGLWETYGRHYRLTPNNTRKVFNPPPFPLNPDQVALGFQQEDEALDHHSRGAQDKIHRYYSADLLARVRKLYAMDYALWDALQVAGSRHQVHGRDIAAILDPIKCSTTNTTAQQTTRNS
eukprot:scaffold1323_cov160-Amphora_coffeaeformis.AAC.21